jgi:hypothetical protein
MAHLKAKGRKFDIEGTVEPWVLEKAMRALENYRKVNGYHQAMDQQVMHHHDTSHWSRLENTTGEYSPHLLSHWSRPVVNDDDTTHLMVKDWWSMAKRRHAERHEEFPPRGLSEHTTRCHSVFPEYSLNVPWMFIQSR